MEALIQGDVDLHEWNQLHLDLEPKSGLQHDVEGRWSEYGEFSWETKNQRSYKGVGWSFASNTTKIQLLCNDAIYHISSFKHEIFSI